MCGSYRSVIAKHGILQNLLEAHPEWNQNDENFAWSQFIQKSHKDASESIVLALSPFLEQEVLAWVQQFLMENTPDPEMGTGEVSDSDEGQDDDGEA